MSPPPPSDQTILLSGISGFVGTWIAHTFLEAGYKVRGTVRSEKSIEGIKKTHAKYADQLSFAVVPDITTSGAFDEAVKGVTGVIHTANPFILNPKDNETELLQPSIQGVLNALKAAKTQGSKIRRVVLTASFADILDISKGDRPGYTYSEKDWNPATYEEAKASDSGAFSYCAAKGLAEQAAWEWIETNKPDFSFVALCPPWIFGPTFGGIKSLDHLNESTEAIWKLVDGSAKEVPPVEFGGFCDVRVVAAAHLRALEREEAGGQRIIPGSDFNYQNAVDAIRQDFPELKDRVPEGKPGAGKNWPIYHIDHSKAEKLLGLEFTPLAVTLKDTVSGLIEAEKKANA
ncbi:hypothetical protein LTR84_010667 [Exophiala bonariae]|uniref:NAD-dependent epimerase/dehydratase domain-containing protein n=1 Tax=Exophiala bonariae TaxID=1690606 RepID=A0AAV9MV44_9EURO|nr:hypothetical protein LTR84_010667 [Exophiala bonariae]